MAVFVVVLVAVAVLVGVLVIGPRLGVGRSSEPGVQSFQRHLGALSPEARRLVQDRVRPRVDEDDDVDDDTYDDDDDGRADDRWQG